MHDPAGSIRKDVSVRSVQKICPVDPLKLEASVRTILDQLGIHSCDISILIVDDPTMSELNLRHLNHQGSTDIITFPISDPGDEHLEGELVICAPWAARVAAENHDSTFDEILLYATHGILHLTGQDDLTEHDAKIMKRREYEILLAIGATIPKGRFDSPGTSDSSG